MASLVSQAEKGEEGSCPICRQGPVKVRIYRPTLYSSYHMSLWISQEDQLLEIVRRKKVRGVSIGIEPETEGFVPDAAPPSSPEFVLRKNDFKSSTKLNALAYHLRQLPHSS